MMTLKEIANGMGKEFVTSDIAFDMAEGAKALNRMLRYIAPGYEFLFLGMPERDTNAVGIMLVFNQSKGGDSCPR